MPWRCIDNPMQAVATRGSAELFPCTDPWPRPSEGNSVDADLLTLAKYPIEVEGRTD